MSKLWPISKVSKLIPHCWIPFSSVLSRRHFSVNITPSKSVFAVTGIQSSGKPHLGNYLGVIKPCIKYCRNNDVSQFFMIIADLHAVTSQNCASLEHQIHELAVTLLACGFESKSLKQLMFLQSSVAGHTELAWILSSVCSFRRLAHLPQWREKSGYYNTASNVPTTDDRQITDVCDTVSVGLFTYPVLQAADILLYGANVVPVGIDQITHIELARDLVRSAVQKWPSLSSVLQIPDSLIFETPKITDLRNPTKKMSKSETSEYGIVYLTDSPDIIRKKIKRAETDSIRGISYDIVERPGVSNLLRILAALEDRQIDDILSTASQWSKEDLKSRVTDALIEEFDPIRKRIDELMYTDDGQSIVTECLTFGAEQANEVASKRLELIYSTIGCKLPSGKRNFMSSSYVNTIKTGTGIST
uniref:tryptophan--tRNA ligase n=1 Tax=Trichobilharzia regenti TaxID=157069 RepID=A0AA85KKC3_TRIRE|nr:unnamed protein product [Trichobilharzia regenti]